MKTRVGVSDLNDGTMKATSDESKAQVLNNFFSSVLTDEDLSYMPACDKPVLTSILDEIQITEAEVCKKLKNLNPSKSPGPDGFHPRLLKETAEILAGPVYLHLED